MDLNLIKKLIKVVENSDITEFSVQEGDMKIKISKNGGETVQQVAIPQQVQMAAPAPAQETPKSQSAETPSESGTADENLYEIKSPIVGTFYRAPAPDADPYVKVGDKVGSGTVLCIVEAMKLMNEIESDVSGTVVKILVENATPVEYNQPLFLIKPD